MQLAGDRRVRRRRSHGGFLKPLRALAVAERASVTTHRQLRGRVCRFSHHWNRTARPFRRTFKD